MDTLAGEFLDPENPTSGICFQVTPRVVNAVDVLHGGAMATALELAAYLALLPTLREDENAVTHAFSASYLSAAETGATAVASGSLHRRGRRLAFVSYTLRVGYPLVAQAQVTKSILS